MKKRILGFTVLALIIFALPISAIAQTYYFSVDQEIVHVYWEDDGTLTLDYVIVFTNSPGASPIDFVDIGFPNNNYSISNVSADIDGHPILNIEDSPYVDSGVALGLGGNAIQPGQTGQVHVRVTGIRNVLYTDSGDDTYASAVFSPNWFGSEYVYGSTDMQVTFHLPPGVEPEEPRWHRSPSGGWPSEPVATLDTDGRITYSWYNPNANGYTQYKFGASFPKTYVPASAIATLSIWDRLGINPEDIMGFLCCGGITLFIILIGWGSIASANKRKMKYLPPKIRIEGHGIKRGLTAIEAAVLMEQPVDKVLTMILFAVLKKEAATVVARDPLKIDVQQPIQSDLRYYERDFLEAFAEGSKSQRKRDLQDLMVRLIKNVGKKMKGFSHKETVAYYKSIMRKAWKQIEDADTPEVRSEKYDEHMGWTMLDKDFDQRTEDVFRREPVFVPMWWHRYDPRWSRPRPVSSKPSTAGSGSGPAPSMPNLPGGAFAASMVTGMQGFASDVVGNVTSFTDRITNKTNPVPKSSSSGWSSSGGSSCACACACAGCACACAGGGR